MDKKTGRIKDVVIEQTEEHTLIVWADRDLIDQFKKIEGLVYVNATITKYYMEFDHRYDIEFIKREIEAIALCVPIDREEN